MDGHKRVYLAGFPAGHEAWRLGGEPFCDQKLSYQICFFSNLCFQACAMSLPVAFTFIWGPWLTAAPWDMLPQAAGGTA